MVFSTEILMAQKIGECGVTCRTIFVVMETIVRVLVKATIIRRAPTIYRDAPIILSRDLK